MMMPRLIKCKRLHPLAVFKNTFSRFSLDSVRERKIFGRNPLKLGMKANSILAIAMVVIMLVSVFAWLSTGTQSKPNIVQPQSNNSTSSPSPTTQVISNATTKPDVISGISPWASHVSSGVTSGFNPTPKAPGLIESSTAMNSDVWRTVAANAWKYFQPGTGVDSTTGLPAGSSGWNYFTDWDLGVYSDQVVGKYGLKATTRFG